MIVDVYWNLNKNCWSIRDSKTRRVIGHAVVMVLWDATFHVSEAGRQRVLRERRKNVHAFVRGVLLSTSENSAQGGGKRVSYNPYKCGHFFLAGDESAPIHSAEWARFTTDARAFVYGNLG